MTIEASGLDGGYAFVKGDVSSQFLSGLLMALPYSRERTTVEVQGALVSQPYVSMTLAGDGSLRRDGRQPQVPPLRRPARPIPGPRFAIEPDASAASYFFALAAITGGTITVEGLGGSSLQGDMAFVDILEYMGCSVVREPARTTVTGGRLRAVDVDMNAISDTVMTLAVVALFADGASRIRNVAHIRHKESDRIAALAVELRKLGRGSRNSPTAWSSTPLPPDRLRGRRSPPTTTTAWPCRLALAGLRIPGVTILDPGCVAKTYPGFWDDLRTAALGRRMRTDRRTVNRGDLTTYEPVDPSIGPVSA